MPGWLSSPRSRIRSASACSPRRVSSAPAVSKAAAVPPPSRSAATASSAGVKCSTPSPPGCQNPVR